MQYFQEGKELIFHFTEAIVGLQEILGPGRDRMGQGPSILARSHTFAEIDHEVIFTVILSSSDTFKKAVVSY